MSYCINNKKFYKYLAIPYFIILICFVLIPIFIVFFDSIQEYNPNHIFNFSFTIKKYYNFYTTKSYIYILFRSIAITIISTFFLIIIAYPLAYTVY
ncbi:MAG: ABC transporter permease, partial [Candidatus Phytoplasma stylosanthis]|nr:ABC transporter permease [Candidatus Phytoplasma stylosanthis]